jgi:hypothetical protein
METQLFHPTKISSFKKSSFKNRAKINEAKILYDESKHNILCLGRQGQQNTRYLLHLG